MTYGHYERETRWFRVYRYAGSTLYESKFLGGEAAVSLASLRREWPVWTPDERLEFASAFAVKATLDADDEEIAEFLFQQTDERVLVVAAPLATRHSNRVLSREFLVGQLLRPGTEPKANFIQALMHIGDAEAGAALRLFYNRMRPQVHADPDTVDPWFVLDFLDCCEALLALEKDVSYLSDVRGFLASPDEMVRMEASRILAQDCETWGKTGP